MIRPEFIIEEVRRNFGDADLEMIWRAYAFAARRHRGQTRVSGEPYLSHPLEVAHILARMKLGYVSVSVGLLHDTLEDTLAEKDEIIELFGEEVAEIVDGVTKLSMIESKSRIETRVENIRKMMLAMAKDIRVILVKLADRTHNMRTLGYLPEAKRIQIARDTLEIFAPIANRLGINWMKTELEDLSFRHLMPDDYERIAKATGAVASSTEDYLDKTVKQISDRLNDRLDGPVMVKGRLKHFYSIYQKMERRKISFDEVFDIIGARVITDTKSDCYRALGEIHQLYTPIPGKLKDYIALPKENMYQSLHTTVLGVGDKPIEIQIRSKKMDEFCEEGIAAHWRYKEGGAKEGKYDKNIVWLRRLLDWQREASDPRQFMSNLKIDLYPDEVYVFTPRQEVKALASGATPIDFAYAIHSDIGQRCIGAKINGKISSIRKPLKNGDIVEILTSRQSAPSRDWLKYVVTSKARSKISAYLNQAEREQALDFGRELLRKGAIGRGLDPEELFKKERLAELAKQSGYANGEALLVALGFGRARPSIFFDRLASKKELLERRDEKARSIHADHPTSTPSSARSGIIVGGFKDMLIRFAKCCSPAPGESISGFVSKGRGLTIHAADCRNALNMGLESERRVDVSWDMTGQARVAAILTVLTTSAPGTLATISSVVSEAGLNISALEARDISGGLSRTNLTVDIADIDQLNKIIAELKRCKGVISVERLRGRGSFGSGSSPHRQSRRPARLFPGRSRRVDSPKKRGWRADA